jgi:hypothetical protein
MTRTRLNDAETAQFAKMCARRGKSQYAVLRQLIRESLEREGIQA